jgi:hypothetical protein
VEGLQVYMLSGTLPPRTLDRQYFEGLQQELGGLAGVNRVGMSVGSPPLTYLAEPTARVAA